MTYAMSNYSIMIRDGNRGRFNGRPLVQWPTRPLGGWALGPPGLGGPGRL